MALAKSNSVPKALQPTCDAVVAVTDPFLAEHLTAGYAEFARSLTAALCHGPHEVQEIAVAKGMGPDAPADRDRADPRHLRPIRSIPRHPRARMKP